ncbi:Smr domain-containing protein [Caenorhabditis elegans]|uniref:Smr domain-containing protein n=1 Tax=Caenorhabditis elegans TaxID=6239 RepID=Q9XX08_CAEEL|nr:Smr domain-containing protein [Caenorhabditis elegans]CAA21034.1 Smr domain-containing protein [Caenorhabditis elegans]|eukprot:NP_507201.1 Uncharacterized protein CELE_Y32B12C.1 [Caenorhabditis elegans]
MRPEELTKRFNEFSLWMTEEGVEQMSSYRNTNWEALKTELGKLPTLRHSCKNHVPQLVKEFCLEKRRYGVNPMYVHFLFCYYKKNIEDTRGRLEDDKETLEEIQRTHDELNVKFEELNKVKTFIKKQKESKGNVYLPNEYTEKHRLQNTIDNLKDKIQILVSTRNEQLWDFDNIPDGFQPMLELHHLKKDQVVYFVEKYLQRYTLGNKHKEIQLIVGKGSHSIDNDSAIQRKIRRNYAENVRSHPKNYGILLLKVP